MNSLGLETLWQDLRYGARLLRRNPTFAIVAILTLALGTGANAAIFQLVDAIRLRTLPVDRRAAPRSASSRRRTAGQGSSTAAGRGWYPSTWRLGTATRRSPTSSPGARRRSTSRRVASSAPPRGYG